MRSAFVTTSHRSSMSVSYTWLMVRTSASPVSIVRVLRWRWTSAMCCFGSIIGGSPIVLVVGLAGFPGEASLTFAAGHLGGHRVQVRRPEAPELPEPGVRLAQGGLLHRVEPARAVRPHGGEAVVAQHLEVLGDGGLGDAELGPDDLGEGAGGLLAVGEQFQDAPANGIAEHVERMHR